MWLTLDPHGTTRGGPEHKLIIVPPILPEKRVGGSVRIPEISHQLYGICHRDAGAPKLMELRQLEMSSRGQCGHSPLPPRSRSTLRDEIEGSCSFGGVGCAGAGTK